MIIGNEILWIYVPPPVYSEGIPLVKFPELLNFCADVKLLLSVTNCKVVTVELRISISEIGISEGIVLSRILLMVDEYSNNFLPVDVEDKVSVGLMEGVFEINTDDGTAVCEVSN